MWEYAWRFSSHLLGVRVPLVLFVLSWTSLRSSVDISVMSAPISRRASTLRCRSMVMERLNILAILSQLDPLGVEGLEFGRK